MPYLQFFLNGVLMPSPSTLSADGNIIWSDNAGRGAVTAKAIGDIIAEKEKFAIAWKYLKKNDFLTVKNNLSTKAHPFINFRIVNTDDDTDEYNLTVYSGTLKKKFAQFMLDNVLTYEEVSTELVEQ